MILLTGASGFIGSHLLQTLLDLYGKENVVALTSKPVPNARYLLHDNYHFEEDYFRRHGYADIDTVIHAGAFTPKNAAQASDWLSCNSNIINTQSLLQSLPTSVNKIIFLSTLDVYGNADIITESSAVDPVSLYGHSKLYCEKMVEAYAKEKHKVVQVLRVGHVYGPGEEQYEKMIPNTFRRIINHLPLSITGSGADIRSFIFISDLVAAIVKSLELSRYDGPINLVGSEKITIKDLVMKIQEITGDHTAIEYIASDRPVRNLQFDNSKMKNMLAAEKYDLQKGLTEEWDYMNKKGK